MPALDQSSKDSPSEVMPELIEKYKKALLGFKEPEEVIFNNSALTYYKLLSAILYHGRISLSDNILIPMLKAILNG